tara:strand:+ start:1358 stop:1573 length:216 start_codon:yes stop_codon:yes gene_type:complete
MSKKTPSQDSNSDIQWDIEELKNAIKRSAEDHPIPIEQWDSLLNDAGQHDQGEGMTHMIWATARKQGQQLT